MVVHHLPTSFECLLSVGEHSKTEAAGINAENPDGPVKGEQE